MSVSSSLVRMTRRPSGAAAFLLMTIAVTFLVYVPGLHGPFLFDDLPNVVENTALTRAKSSLLDWWSAAQSSAAGPLRRPLPMLSFALQLPDGAPHDAFALKAGNLLVHLVCGLLLAWLAASLYRAVHRETEAFAPRIFGVLVAAMWLLNPLHVSTVLYPVQRMAQFAALFTLLGLAQFAAYRLRWQESAARVEEVLALALWLLLSVLLGVLSKENAVLLPWLVAVLEVSIFRGRLNGADNPFLRRLGGVAFALPLVGLFLLFTWQWNWLIGGYAYREFTLAERLWTESRVLWSYTGWILLPRLGELGLFHDDIAVSRGWLQPWTTILSVCAWPCALLLAWRLRQAFPWLLLGLLFFLVAHSMESTVLPLELVFEHRNYLPAAGLALPLAAALMIWARRAAAAPALRIASIAAVLLLFTLSTAVRSIGWSSELTMASDSYARHPESKRSAHFYANALLKERSLGTLTPRESATYLTLARHEFEALHQRDPLDLSALVMLYTMDSRFDTAVADPQRWLAGIEESVAVSKLKATEWAAMRVLMSCVANGACRIDNARLDVLLETFAGRYIHTHGSAQLQLDALDRRESSIEERIALAEAWLRASPSNSALHFELIAAWLELGDYAAAHRVIRHLLSVDSMHRQLTLLEALFAAAETSAP